MPMTSLYGAAYILLWIASLLYLAQARGRSQPAQARTYLGWAATGAAGLAWGLLAAGLAARGLAAGHWPLTNRYEFALGLTWVIVSMFLLIKCEVRLKQTKAPLADGTLPSDKTPTGINTPQASVLMLATTLLAGAFALTRPASEQAIAPLLPALRSAWLQVHVISALLAYGAFSLAAGLALLPQPAVRSAGLEPLADKAPPAYAGKTDRPMLRMIEWGCVALTLSILSGAIWAQAAWGRYWGWDPKEIWALMTWLWYMMILHLKSQPRWRGRRLAWLVTAGLAVVWFTFAGLPWLVQAVRLESLHGF